MIFLPRPWQCLRPSTSWPFKIVKPWCLCKSGTSPWGISSLGSLSLWNLSHSEQYPKNLLDSNFSATALFVYNICGVWLLVSYCRNSWLWMSRSLLKTGQPLITKERWLISFQAKTGTDCQSPKLYLHTVQWCASHSPSKLLLVVVCFRDKISLLNLLSP